MDGFKRRPQQARPALDPHRTLPRPVALDEARIPAVAASHAEVRSQQPPAVQPSAPQSLSSEALAPPRKKGSMAKKLLAVALGVVLVLGLMGFAWYQTNLSPRNANDPTEYKVVIAPGASVGYVAESLENRGIIKDKLAFQVYAQLAGSSGGLKEGTCIVKASQSVAEILSILSEGCNEFKPITFYPGATIEKPLYKPVHAQLDQTMYIKYRLRQAGFSDAQITAALNKTYQGPVFDAKPAGTSLEGYIYGETYYVDTDATAEQVLQMTFDQMYKDLQANGLPQKFANQGLTMYEAITLASIVQRELNCEGKPTEERKERCYGYQRTIAQIFLKRLKEGGMLGSDVTFIYAADMLGIAPTVDIDSPYNTRIHAGLPPGPIAAPGLLALKAVGNPTDTDYYFFIAGDDGLIYFAKDLAGHEANIKNHCQQLCNEL